MQRRRLDVPIIGVARSGWDLARLRRRARESVEHDAGGKGKVDEEAFARLSKLLGYIDCDYNDPRTFQRLAKELGDAQRPLHYLAIPPSKFATVTEGLAAAGSIDNARVIVEKPFGRDLASAIELNQILHRHLPEDRIFRMDHFLGKEGTQDLHVLRFANLLFSRIWSREQVAQVQIDVPEVLDVVDRAEFYDATGAALDMLVSHLFQVAAEVAMEPPASLSPTDLQAARESVLACFRPLDPARDVVLGQYRGYQDLDGVADESDTETFVAARLWVDSDRWRGVPFLLRSGKRMAVSAQRVSLLLRTPDGPVACLPEQANVVSLSLSGSGALEIDLATKEPGPDLTLARAATTLDLTSVPGAVPLPPYVSLLHDVLTGDRSLFTSSDGLARAWAAFAPLQQQRPTVHRYEPGSWGPSEAAALAGPDGWLLGRQARLPGGR